MEELTGLTASAAGGGLFGLVGTALGRIANYLDRRSAQRHETRRWAHEIKRVELDLQSAIETANAERERAAEEGRWAGLEASLAAEAAIAPSYRWVDAIRALTRPVLTILLWLIATIVFFSSDNAGRAAIVDTATFAATAATLWWFGDRGPSQRAR